MRAILPLCLVSVALATNATSWARLGETEEECEKRYGKASVPDLVGDLDSSDGAPSLKEDKVLQFAKDGMTIYVGFIDRKASSIQYSFSAARKTPLQRHEVETLLNLNAPNKQWYFHFEPFLFEEDPPVDLHNDSGILWSTDGDYCAFFTRGMPVFSIRRIGLCPIFSLENTPSPSLDSL